MLNKGLLSETNRIKSIKTMQLVAVRLVSQLKNKIKSMKPYLQANRKKINLTTPELPGVYTSSPTLGAKTKILK